MTPTQGDRTAATDRPVGRRVAVVLTLGCLMVAAFQAALTLGAPLGAAALGGANAGTLPDDLRVVTAVSTLAWFGAALIVLARGGFAISPIPRAIAKWGTWVLVCFLAVGTLLNLASSSPWERFGWAPFSLTMLTLCVILARSDFTTHAGSRTRA